MLNRWSSESRYACMFGRVATEEDEVKCTLFKTAGQKQRKQLLLKSRYGLGIHIVIVFLALVFYGCEIIQYTNRCVGQTHVIP